VPKILRNKTFIKLAKKLNLDETKIEEPFSELKDSIDKLVKRVFSGVKRRLKTN